jgi:dienelactone hydrolase
VHAVIANVPSHLVWQGTVNARETMTSGWSVGGTPLPYAALGPWREGASWREQFDAALIEAPADAEIPVERINGPILFISGTDDGVWPCSAMADAAVDRLVRHHFGFEVEHARYEHGGHVLLTQPYRVGPVENPWPAEHYRQPRWLRAGFPAVQMGGTSEGNRLARMDAWPKTISFLTRHL